MSKKKLNSVSLKLFATNFSDEVHCGAAVGSQPEIIGQTQCTSIPVSRQTHSMYSRGIEHLRLFILPGLGVYKSVPTKGDGMCGLHAIYGRYDRESGYLQVPDLDFSLVVGKLGSLWGLAPTEGSSDEQARAEILRKSLNEFFLKYLKGGGVDLGEKCAKVKAKYQALNSTSLFSVPEDITPEKYFNELFPMYMESIQSRVNKIDGLYPEELKVFADINNTPVVCVQRQINSDRLHPTYTVERWNNDLRRPVVILLDGSGKGVAHFERMYPVGIALREPLMKSLKEVSGLSLQQNELLEVFLSVFESNEAAVFRVFFNADPKDKEQIFRDVVWPEIKSKKAFRLGYEEKEHRRQNIKRYLKRFFSEPIFTAFQVDARQLHDLIDREGNPVKKWMHSRRSTKDRDGDKLQASHVV